MIKQGGGWGSLSQLFTNCSGSAPPYTIYPATLQMKSLPSMGMPPRVTEMTCRPRVVGTHSQPMVPSPSSPTKTSGARVAESGGRTRTL